LLLLIDVVLACKTVTAAVLAVFINFCDFDAAQCLRRAALAGECKLLLSTQEATLNRPH